MMLEYSEKTRFNQYIPSKKSRIGILTSGMASNYTRESIRRLGVEEDVHLMILGMPYPAPPNKIAEMLAQCDKVLCVEEGDPLIERQVHHIAKDTQCGVNVYGKLTGQFIPAVDELNPDVVSEGIVKFLDLKTDNSLGDRDKIVEELSELVVPRSSSWCAGCPHLGSFWALKKALPPKEIPIINTGIGCYEMSGYGIAAAPIDAQDTKESKRWRTLTPYEMTDTLYIMGSETGLPQGQFHAGYKDGPLISVLGDSSFFHTNLPSIVNGVYNKAEHVILVLDNYWTSMTGHQPNPATGITAMGEETIVPSIEDICKAYGVKFVRCTDAYDLKASKEAIKEALAHKGGPAVVVIRRVCALQHLRELRSTKTKTPLFVVNDKCNGCKQCLYLGCPAIGFDMNVNNAKGRPGKAFIDPLLCVGCALCADWEVCKFDAVEVE